MIQRQFLSTLLWLIVVNLLVKAIFIFGIDMQVQQRVGASAYGLYFVLLNLTYIFQIIHDFGLNLLHNTDTAHHGRIRQEQWTGILRMKGLLSLLYVIVVMAVAAALGYGASWSLLVWLVVNNILISWISVLRAGISGMARYNMEALISVMDKALMILICGWMLLYIDPFRIEWFIWAQTASFAITAFMAWLVSRPMWEKAGTIPPVKISAILRDALPFSVMVFLMFVYTRSDSILLEKLLPDGTYAAGVYAAGFRLLDAANMIAFLFTPLLIPMYARLQSKPGETNDLIRLASGMMVCMSGCISIAGFYWAPEIIALCYGQEDHQWVITFRLLILSHIPVGLMYIFGSYLTAVRQLRPQILLFIFSVLANIGLNLYCIPRWGTAGAASVALITQGLTTVGLILLSNVHLNTGKAKGNWIRPVAYLLTMAGTGWMLSSLPLHWVAEAVLFLIAGLAAAFLFRLMHVDAFMDLVRQRVSPGNGGE